ncbi:MAG: hypothetical protein WCP53_08690, partial [Verrucomicrobiota bacterium]
MERAFGIEDFLPIGQVAPQAGMLLRRTVRQFQGTAGPFDRLLVPAAVGEHAGDLLREHGAVGRARLFHQILAQDLGVSPGEEVGVDLADLGPGGQWVAAGQMLRFQLEDALAERPVERVADDDVLPGQEDLAGQRRLADGELVVHQALEEDPDVRGDLQIR